MASSKGLERLGKRLRRTLIRGLMETEILMRRNWHVSQRHPKESRPVAGLPGGAVRGGGPPRGPAQPAIFLARHGYHPSPAAVRALEPRRQCAVRGAQRDQRLG